MYAKRKTIELSALCIILFAAISIVAVSALGDVTGTKLYSWRYKITVNVETPEGMKTGSAIRETTVALKPYPIDPQYPYRTSVSTAGEAVVVDMGERGVLFALVDVDDHRLVFQAFPSPEPPLTPAGIEFYASLPIGSEGMLNPHTHPGYPKLVTFADPSDPKSVMLAQVWSRNQQGQFELEEDRMEALFGKNVKLSSIIVAITNKPIQYGPVSRYLRWIHSYRNTLLDGSDIHTSNSDYPVANMFGGGNFITKRKSK